MLKNTYLFSIAGFLTLGAIFAESAEALSFTGNLEPGETQQFKFKATEAFEFLSISTNGSNFDTELGLYDDAGNIIAINDDINDDFLSLILANNSSRLEGTLTAVLGGFDTVFGRTLNNITPGTEGGDYALTLNTLDLASSNSFNGSYERNSLLRFPITPVEDLQFLIVDSGGSDFDTELGLYDADGNLISANDDFNSDILQSQVIGFADDGNYDGGLTAVLGAFNTEYGETIDDISISSVISGNYQLNVEQYISAGSVRSVPENSGVLGFLAFGTAMIGFTMKHKEKFSDR